MRYYIGADHAGYEIKDFVKNIFLSYGDEVIDVGTFDDKRVDYPDFAKIVSKKILDDIGSQGVLICGTGIGMSISANRFQGIRAALCHDSLSAILSKQHNDANILCLGSRVSGKAMIEQIIKSWRDCSFEQGRHTNRVKKIDKL
ncbi:MAG: ribose 5-phosphate isomerase B [Campylobacteraceae bacterium 4484_166]|nr:MAG: ribose 5-phosphate isomerase B [Campylobacteraceae bacterium 4484_166]